MNRLLQLLPLLPAFALVGVLQRSLVVPGLLVAVALFTPQKRTPQPVSTIVPMAIAGAIGFFLSQQFAELRELSIEMAGYRGMVSNLVATATGLAAAVAIRRRWSKPEGGEALTLAVALLGIVLAALFIPRWITAIALTTMIVFSLLTLPEAKQASLSVRGKVRTGIALLVGAAVAGGLALLLPWIQGRAIALLESGAVASSSGLADHISLGHEVDIKPSDERVLRLHVESDAAADWGSDSLRGFVFTRYAKGEWRPSPWPATVHPQAPRVSRSTVTIELAAPATRVLLPLDLAELSVPAHSLRVDSTGIPIAEHAVDGYSFRTGTRKVFPISPPQSEDLLVPAAVREALEPVAREWTSGVTNPEGQLAAIVKVLHRDFRWSLQSRRSTHADPVVDFVLHEHVGHCEYFASAMALLARIQGIPARVVGGYRVAEYNPLDGSYVVRKSNAHAWVEAWVEGVGWRSYDPTPETEANTPHKQSLFAALADLVRAHPVRAVMALSVLVAMTALALSVRERLARKPTRDDEPTLPHMAALVRVIARRTRRRLAGETLLEWAREVAQSDELAVVERYHALRWGDAADAALVEMEAARLVRKF